MLRDPAPERKPGRGANRGQRAIEGNPMAYTRRRTSRPLVKMGPDGDGQRSMVEGTLVAIRPSEKYEHSFFYDFDTAEGPLTVTGCSALNTALTPADVGREFRLRFTGHSTLKSGSKMICVEVDERIPDDAPPESEPPLPDGPPEREDGGADEPF